MQFADHFSTVAAQYAAYRPHYPRALVEALAGLCTHRDVAWDVGCGSGQLSIALADEFEKGFGWSGDGRALVGSLSGQGTSASDQGNKEPE